MCFIFSQPVIEPPLTAKVAPVMNETESLTKNVTAADDSNALIHSSVEEKLNLTRRKLRSKYSLEQSEIRVKQ